ncbi:unnamed protein product [Albugo candida]|uniref:Uncharacterized protein n=1 Tax=Albugo candida TaxID=65357 RepID=A0A024FU67_9STRA|nr:unnamed protein product [Albugo candida]|eukprot:CCI10670.1 unnamed protein product [Albugo candida]
MIYMTKPKPLFYREMKKTTLALFELSLVESVNQRLLYQAQIAHIRAQLYPGYHQVELALVELDRRSCRYAISRADVLRKLKASVTAALNQSKMESIRHQFQEIYQNQTSMIWRLLKRWILTISTRILVTATLEPVQPQRSKYIDSFNEWVDSYTQVQADYTTSIDSQGPQLVEEDRTDQSEGWILNTDKSHNCRGIKSEISLKTTSDGARTLLRARIFFASQL